MWKKSPASDFAAFGKSGDWQGVYAGFRPVDYISSNKKMRGIELKTYLWNKKNSGITLKDFKIEVRQGNAMVYGLFHDME